MNEALNQDPLAYKSAKPSTTTFSLPIRTSSSSKKKNNFRNTNQIKHSLRPDKLLNYYFKL